MNKETKKALEDSIAHWEENLELAKKGKLTTQNLGSDNCSLCRLFLAKSCGGCPVKDETGNSGCVGTPYHLVLDLFLWGVPRNLNLNVSQVQKELDFLKSLMPEE